MAVMGFLFFVSVMAASVWAIVSTVAPRAGYITALLSGSAAVPVLVPVAQRRRVRRITPLSYGTEVRMIRAAA